MAVLPTSPSHQWQSTCPPAAGRRDCPYTSHRTTTCGHNTIGDTLQQQQQFALFVWAPLKRFVARCEQGCKNTESINPVLQINNTQGSRANPANRGTVCWIGLKHQQWILGTCPVEPCQPAMSLSTPKCKNVWCNIIWCKMAASRSLLALGFFIFLSQLKWGQKGLLAGS